MRKYWLRSITEKAVFFFSALILVSVLFLLGLYLGLRNDLPQLPNKLENINLSLPTEIYSEDGELIKVLGERHPVFINEISPHFLKAIIAVEDGRFYEHKGLDHIGLIRALYTNIKHRRVVQGGSTITQQLSKNLFFSFKRNWRRKIKELLVALQMEATFPKDKILEAYCNQVYFGSGAYGVEEAAQVYFGIRARELTLYQAAILAGLPNSPNNANPYSNYERSLKRAEYVLQRMRREEIITEAEMEEALTSDLKLKPARMESNPNLYFVNYVVDKLEKEYGKEFVHFGGLKIITTLDSRYQEFAQKSAESHLHRLEKRLGKKDPDFPLQAAIVAIENKTGAVRALLGGRQYSLSQFNRAISNNRLPGSSFKPLVYLTAMETLGISPATVIKDEPIAIEIQGMEPWKPRNFNNTYSGDVVLKKALMNSINIISAKLVQQVTPERVIKTARQFGITSPLGNHMSIALGTSAVSPLEMASAYSVISNLGVYNEPYFVQRIEDFQGNPVYEHFYHGQQRASQKSVYPLLDMMMGVVDRGTGRVIRSMGFKHPAGGKTGTTNNFKDAWFIGFTKELSVSVWVGKDNNEPMISKQNKGFTGGSAAAPIWGMFMQKATQGKSPVKFPVPEEIKIEDVDVQTGYLADETTEHWVRVAVKEETNLTNLVPEEKELPEPSLAEDSKEDQSEKSPSLNDALPEP